MNFSFTPVYMLWWKWLWRQVISEHSLIFTIHLPTSTNWFSGAFLDKYTSFHYVAWPVILHSSWNLKRVFAPTAVRGRSSWHLLIVLPESWFALLRYTVTRPLTLPICHGLPTALLLLIAKSSTQRCICMIGSWSPCLRVNFTSFMLIFSVLHFRAVALRQIEIKPVQLFASLLVFVYLLDYYFSMT